MSKTCFSFIFALCLLSIGRTSVAPESSETWDRISNAPNSRDSSVEYQDETNEGDFSLRGSRNSSATLAMAPGAFQDDLGTTLTFSILRSFTSIFQVGIMNCVYLIFAYFYKKNVVDRKHVLGPQHSQPDTVGLGYKHGLCECFGDCSVCLHGWFCTPVRIADTYHTAGVCDFWATLLLSAFFPCCFFVIMLPCKHAEIRGKIGGSSACNIGDFCVSFFCTPCVVCQEARAVDESVGVKTFCCCDLQAIDDARVPLVGEVVAVSSVPVLMPAQGLGPASILQAPPSYHVQAVPLQPLAVAQSSPVQVQAYDATQVLPQQQQALHVSGRQVMAASHPHGLAGQTTDTELRPMTDEGDDEQF